MKKYEWIKQESDAETYLINNTYYKVVWGYSTGNETGWHNHIPLTLWHYDRDTGDYYPQKVATRVDFDLLQEAGYY